MRTAYVFTSRFIALMVLFQAAVVAFGVFGLIRMVEDGETITSDTRTTGANLHSIGAMVLSLAVILLLIFSFFAKAEGAVKFALILFGLTLLQWVFAIVAFSAPVVGTLHGLNAFAIAAVAGMAGAKVSKAGVGPAPAGPQDPAASAAAAA